MRSLRHSRWFWLVADATTLMFSVYFIAVWSWPMRALAIILLLISMDLLVMDWRNQ